MGLIQKIVQGPHSKISAKFMMHETNVQVLPDNKVIVNSFKTL